MSDERDETRQFAPSDDATQVGDPTGDEPGPARGDAARSGAAATRPNEDQAGDGDTAADPEPVPDEAVRADDAAVPAGGDTVADLEPVRGDAAARPDATSVMPPADDDWAPARGNPAWTGRAEVRSPRPSGAVRPDEDWAVVVGREPRDRWWMPIVVGIVALVLLAALGFGIYLIVQNSGRNEAPAPTVTTTVAPTGSSAVTTVPTTTTSNPATTEPASTEVTIPALVGLSLPDAQAALSRVGLRRYKVIYRDDDAPPGTVIGSDPAEGQEVPPDTAVTLVVAKGSPSSPTATATPSGSSQEPGGVGGN